MGAPVRHPVPVNEAATRQQLPAKGQAPPIAAWLQSIPGHGSAANAVAPMVPGLTGVLSSLLLMGRHERQSTTKWGFTATLGVNKTYRLD